MTHASPHVRPSLMGNLLQILRTATQERMVFPDVEEKEIDEHILLESHLLRTPPLLFATPQPQFLKTGHGPLR